MTSKQALDAAKAACGSAANLARRLGITAQAVAQWSDAPVERVLEIERVTGVSRYDLRPDIYGEPPSMPDQSSVEAA